MKRYFTIVVAAIAAVTLSAAALYETAPGGAQAQPEKRGHFKTLDAADLGKERARNIYESIRTDMQRDYAMADEPLAGGYQQWTRHNDAPYRSETHGSRFVNNYANDLAADYAAGPEGPPLPAGAAIAKDAFAVTGDGDIYAQSLFIMEKLASGTSPATGNWRYVMITPKGETYGDTAGADADKVAFCHGCHKAAEKSDYLFHVPRAYRIGR